MTFTLYYIPILNLPWSPDSGNIASCLLHMTSVGFRHHECYLAKETSCTVAHAWNSSIQEAKQGGWLLVLNHPSLHSENEREILTPSPIQHTEISSTLPMSFITTRHLLLFKWRHCMFSSVLHTSQPLHLISKYRLPPSDYQPYLWPLPSLCTAPAKTTWVLASSSSCLNEWSPQMASLLIHLSLPYNPFFSPYQDSKFLN